MYRAIIFDIGQTLVEYHKPLSWSGLYRPALQQTALDCGYDLSEEDYSSAVSILSKYNTRINPREREVSSTEIFTELLHGIHQSTERIEQAKHSFYSYFRNDVVLFPEVENTLKELTARGIMIGTLSDVAYGMDNKYALADIAAIQKYIAYPYTSNDTGFRKPCAEGLLLLIRKMNMIVSEVLFIGDEEKDILCAQNAGVRSILIDRTMAGKDYGQDIKIHSLDELLKLLDQSVFETHCKIGGA